MASQTVRFYEFGPFRIDLLSQVLLRDNKPLPLEPKVFDTLLFLVQNHAKVVSKNELMNAVWGPDTFVEEGSLVRNISLLRKTLAEGLGDTQCIATFPKRGYQFVAPVRDVTGTSQVQPAEGAHRHVPAEIDKGHPQGALLQIVRRHPIAVLVGGVAVLALALGYWFVRPLPAPVVRDHQALTDDGREKQGPLLTDGRRLYFKEQVDGRCVLAVVPISGGDLNTYPLSSCAAMISDIAADGTDLIGWEEDAGRPMGRLLIWPLAGGPPRSLGGLQGACPAWSPDRSRIAFTDGIHSLLVAGRHGESPRKVASVEGRPERLRWSADGKSLLFEQLDARSEAMSLWEVAAHGGKPRPMLTGWKYEAYEPTSTADGRYFLFVSGSADRPGIWARRENCNPFRWGCREPVRIVAGLGEAFAPLPSRDGKKLFVIGGHYKQELTRYDMKSRTFALYLPSVRSADVDFSPDGKWVAYVRLPERSLWRGRPDGNDSTPLTVAGPEVYSPHWSPDGKRIAYITVSTEKQYKACLVSAEGGLPRQLIPGAGEEGIPTWSRDGNFVVFGDTLHKEHASAMAVHLLDLRSHRVTDLPGSQGLWTPRWSPNGRYIAALVLGDETKVGLTHCPAISLYDTKLRRWETLAKAECIRNLTWSRDSQYVFYHTCTHDLGLYRVETVSKKVERLASIKSLGGLSDDWIGVAPDGSPLIIGDTRIDEIYALDVQWP